MDPLLSGIISAVAGGRKEIYNPLFIYGDPLKTFDAAELLANEYQNKNPFAKIRRIWGEEYAHELVRSIKDNRLEEYKESFSECDMLIFEQVEQICGKQMAMKEFYGMFDKLWESGKQIVITGANAPKELPGLEPRICTQLEGGIIYNTDETV